MHILRLLILCSICLLIAGSAQAESTKDATHPDRFVTIPVYYLTDRNIHKDSYGSERRYKIACKHHMYYGTAYITVPNSAQDLSSDAMNKLGWKVTNQAGPKVSPKDRIDPTYPVKARKAFFDLLSSVLQKSGDDHLCIYVHGAEDAFEDCAEDAADLAYHLKQPVILYSWPSSTRIFKYAVDNGNNEWSQGHFNMFVRQLSVFKAAHPVNITIISHSMGNRLVIRAYHQLKNTALANDLELVSPDIDLETCQHYIMGPDKHQSMIRLYVSRHDKMLVLSQMLFGGYYRLGEGAGGPLIRGRRNRQLQPGSDDGSPPAEQTEDDPEAPALFGPFERIDFTLVDKGFEGHTVPFDLIANMVHSGKPGAGFILMPEKPGDVSKLAKFESWSHGLGDEAAQPGTAYGYRLVRTDPKK